jgi:methionyl-tRNA synthetase
VTTTPDAPRPAGSPIYLTTPIYYVNDAPHIGHTYTTVVTDVLARFHRMRGRDVRFLTGSDEHGQKIERAAQARGLAPLALADQMVARYRELWTSLGISHDDFIRTTERRHLRGVEALYAKIKAGGDIYKDRYAGWYCTSCESFYPENQVVDGRCPDQGHKVEWTEEESYFFRLSRWQEPLLKLYRERPDFVFPETRRNEVVAFVESGLKDLSISRSSFKWGLPFPDDPKHVLYVWFDALSNYITALGYGEAKPPLYARYWPGIHLVGKDILRFHAVYWPAFLLAAGEPPPRQVVAHGWWLRDAAKISKSKGGVVDPLPFIRDFGADALRYVLLREMVFGQDASFSDEAFIDRVNTDLANDLGNLASRALKMIEDYRGGALPAPHGEDASLRDAARAAWDGFVDGFESYALQTGVQRVSEFTGALNRHIVQHEPWKLARDPSLSARLDDILYSVAEGLRVIAVLLAPVIPRSAQTLYAAVGGEGEVAACSLATFRWGVLTPGSRIVRGQPLFPRIDKAAQLAAVSQAADPAAAMKEHRMDQTDVRKDPAPAPAAGASPSGPTTPASPAAAAPAAAPAVAGPAEIAIEDFAKVELRTAKVLQAEKVQGADRLLKLTVDIGTETRTIVAGIAARYAPDALIGRTIVVVANLKPAKLRGITSQGMLLAASDASGAPYILTTEDPGVPAGWRVK